MSAPKPAASRQVLRGSARKPGAARRFLERALTLMVAAFGAVLLFLLIAASANTELFVRHYSLLLAVNAVAALALITLVLVQLRRFWREYKQRVFGSRLKWRLLWMLTLMALLPGVLLYGVSMQFAINSIDSWFDVRVDSALEGGLDLGRSVLDALQADLGDKARAMAADLGNSTDAAANAGRIYRLREQAGAESAILLGANGQVLAASSDISTDLTPTLPTSAQLRKARTGRGLTWVDGDAESGLTLRVLVPVGTRDLIPNLLMLSKPVPAAIGKSAENVEAAYRDYQELQLARDGLKRLYTLTLTLTLTLALFAAVALAFFLARRLAEPLLILAEGTRAVAEGDYTPRVALQTHDELGVLTQSFNHMTRQLDEARRETERHRAALEAARAYLESVLANLSAGVLAFDAKFRLRAANHGAKSILEDELEGFLDLHPEQWPRQRDFARAIVAGFQNKTTEWQHELALEGGGKAPKTLLIRGSTLPTTGGYVVVFDDISEMIAAQRSAAWGEVARRLAHEIKNPLTPIRLSAERLAMKLADRLDPESRAALERATQTIINQVEAMKNMVNDFRDYARTPPPTLASLDLNGLIGDLLGLYETSRAKVRTQLAPGLPAVLADANQMRQVLHNLLANAADALAGTSDPEVTVTTRSEGNKVVLLVSDNGTGFAPQILARAFEPYVTTKAKGTGLGLAIVKKIIDEHRGELRVANRPGGGAEVIIRLPLADAMSAAA